jgi:hypothetical protein
MLEITIPDTELYDEEANEFVSVKGVVLRLEHSLVSISKWESNWKEPFLSEKPKTIPQTIDYVRCMTIGQNIDPKAYDALTPEHINAVNEYIKESRTATTFSETGKSSRRDIITSELIYWWMAQFNIPMECQKWHLSRLLALIRIASIKNSPQKNMSRHAVLSQNAALNAARRRARGSKG